MQRATIVAFVLVSLELMAAQSSGRLFVARDADGTGFIDRSGTMVIPHRYWFAQDFAEGLAPVWLKPRLCGYIDTRGREVITPRFAYCRPFREGVAPVEVEGGWTYIDRSGTPITPRVFDDVGQFGDGLGPFKLDDRWGFIDRAGREAIPPRYRLAWGFWRERAGVYFEGDPRCTFIDKRGEVLFRRDGGDCRGFPWRFAGRTASTAS